MSNRHETGWDGIYHSRRPDSLPWELGEPRELLVNLVDSGELKPSKTLDLCCGVGTNPLYLATEGFTVTALDISDKAIEYAKDQASQKGVTLSFLVADFIKLPFPKSEFDFIFDFGCFHHVDVEDRADFIQGVYRVLKSEGIYLLTCFSYKNGPALNHFTKKQIIGLFNDRFNIQWIKHVSSIEGDEAKRYFYEVLMQKYPKV